VYIECTHRRYRKPEENELSGHSKWSSIKRKKATIDAKRGAHFTKLIREITIAAREGGGDADGNPRLRSAIQAGKSANMPTDNIERAIKKGTGEIEGVVYEETTYEGYGPGGAAIIVEVTTDNINRTVAEVRHIFNKKGGNLGTANSVAWMFERKGQFLIDASKYEEETAMEAVLEAGSEDFETDGETFLVTTDPSQLHTVQATVEQMGIATTDAQLSMIPTNTVKVEGQDARQLLELMDALEDQDDVSRTHSNFDIDPDMLEAASE
jgi:YebC/PmpR family DNA-binding regulatory protein